MPTEGSKAVSTHCPFSSALLALDDYWLNASLFCPAIDLTTHAIAESDLAQLKTQQDLATAWKALVPSFPPSSVHVLPSIEHAVRIVRGVNGQDKKGVDVLVAGSLHLVGGVIEVAGLASVAL